MAALKPNVALINIIGNEGADRSSGKGYGSVGS